MKRMTLTAALLLALVVFLIGCVGPLMQNDPPTIDALIAVNAPGQYGVEFGASVAGGQEPISYR